MAGWWSLLTRWFASPEVVKAVAADEWQVEQQKRCRIYRGKFVVYDVGGRVRQYVHGRIIEWPGLPTDVYLLDPPVELRRHAKGPCLQLVSRDGPWFKLHWEQPARDFSDSRAYVERLLDEAFRRNRREQRQQC